MTQWQSDGIGQRNRCVVQGRPDFGTAFLGVADAVREANAKAMFNAKLDHIDAAMRNASTIGGVLHTTKNEWSEDPDRSPTVPEGSAIRACVD